MSGSSGRPYQYVVLRCVPRVDREEFVNVGVVLYCQAADFLAAACHVDEDRLRGARPGRRPRARCGTRSAFVEGVCRGDAALGDAAAGDLGTRFGFLKAPRSTSSSRVRCTAGSPTTRRPSCDRLLDVLVR